MTLAFLPLVPKDLHDWFSLQKIPAPQIVLEGKTQTLIAELYTRLINIFAVLNPPAFRKTKIAYNFGISECNRVNCSIVGYLILYPKFTIKTTPFLVLSVYTCLPILYRFFCCFFSNSCFVWNFLLYFLKVQLLWLSDSIPFNYKLKSNQWLNGFDFSFSCNIILTGLGFYTL